MKVIDFVNNNKEYIKGAIERNNTLFKNDKQINSIEFLSYSRFNYDVRFKFFDINLLNGDLSKNKLDKESNNYNCMVFKKLEKVIYASENDSKGNKVIKDRKYNYYVVDDKLNMYLFNDVNNCELKKLDKNFELHSVLNKALLNTNNIEVLKDKRIDRQVFDIEVSEIKDKVNYNANKYVAEKNKSKEREFG